MTRSTLFAAFALAASACSRDEASSAHPSEDDLQAALSYSFDASTGAWPPGTTFMFSDYPTNEDADAQSPARIAKQRELGQRLESRLGRPALLTEWARYETDLASMGYWLSARFEKTVDTDATPALVFSQFNASDDLDANILFAFDHASGLASNARYTATATLVLRTNAPVGCFGVGGGPDAVVYALELSRTPFTRGVDTNDHFRMTNRVGGGAVQPGSAIDPAARAGSPLDLGSIGAPNATDCGGWNAFEDVTRTVTSEVETDASGVLHGLLHTHSGFEGASVWALRSFSVTLARH